MSNVSVGSVVEGIVVAKDPKGLYLNLGGTNSGIVWGKELQESSKIVSPLEIGDTIKAKVVSVENEKGLVELSLKEASKEMGWGWIKTVQQNNETVPGKVLAANRGGLIVQAEHTQGFLPTSQMNTSHFPRVEDGNKERILEELKKMIGQEIMIKIIDFNPKENKVIFSEKKIDAEKMQAVLSEKYTVGETVSGKVSKIGRSGVVLSLEDEITGFVPLVEVSWQMIDNLEDVVSVDEEKEAKIIAIENGALKLSFKALEEDPWLKEIENWSENQEVTGRVHKLISIGAMIQLSDKIYGFIHSSEFGGLEAMKEALELDKSYPFVIESIKKDEKRINLKRK